MQTSNTLNSIKNACQIPQIQTAVLNMQHIYDSWLPAMQNAFNQQYQIQAMVPQLKTSVLDLICSSCADMTRNVKVSTLASALDTFANIKILEYDLPTDAPGLTSEESTQLAAEFSEAVEDRQNWQQRLMAIIQRWKIENPVVASIVQLLVTIIITQLLCDLLHWGAAALKNSKIREEPNRKATVICQIKQGETITVIGDAPYYYLVEFDDPDTNELRSGYISKKSVKPTQSDSG